MNKDMLTTVPPPCAAKPEVVATVVRSSTKRACGADISTATQPARVRRCVEAVACGTKRARADAAEHAESRRRVGCARRVAEAGSMPAPRPQDGGGILSGSEERSRPNAG